MHTALNESLAGIVANIRVDVVNILETLDDLTTGKWCVCEGGVDGWRWVKDM